MRNLFKQIFFLTIVTILSVSCTEEERKSTIYSTNFEDFENQIISEIKHENVRWVAKDSVVEISEREKSGYGQYLHFFKGKNKVARLELDNEEDVVAIQFRAMAIKQADFKFRIEGLVQGDWIEIYNGDEEIIAKNRVVNVHIDVDKNLSQIKFLVTSEEMGVFLDDINIYRAAKSTIESVNSRQPVLPTLKRKEINKVVQINIKIDGNLDPVSVESFDFNLNGTTNLKDISQLQLYYSGNSKHIQKEDLFGSSESIDSNFSIKGNRQLQTGDNFFWLSVKLDEASDLSHKIGAECLSVNLTNGKLLHPLTDSLSHTQRIGIALRQAGEDDVQTYRIPGLATTNNGTLIGVYDNRYKQGTDLQGDIDIGMSRSTDGGHTWEAMKPIIDMGEFGGKPQDENGIGDPSLLVDRANNTIWVAGVWAHGHPGKRNWWASKPGISPEKTSQFVIAKSEDDGLTWSEPINITSQIKKAGWYLLLQGPGKGITLKDGTLVFPAQFKDEKEMPHSTIIYSKDHGKTWNIGTGAKENTTEAQVVELDDGRLMLNMRDNRGGSRSVYTTTDLGKNWTAHETSRKSLIEPVCMASLISFNHPGKGQILFFSNPNSTKGRTNITVKTSFDQGKTWPEENQLEIYEDACAGYSCMTLIDENHIGILYEGYSELYFEKININELF